MSIYQNSLSLASQAFSFKAARKVSVSADEYAEKRGQMDAIGSTQAVVHYQTDGTILDANQLFQKRTGYGLDELVGQHHRMLVTPEYAGSPDYKKFWQNLNAGIAQQGAMIYRSVAGNFAGDEGSVQLQPDIEYDRRLRRRAARAEGLCEYGIAPVA